MAGRAIGCGLYVASEFSGGLHTVMAGDARCAGGAVIHFCADGKSARRVAGITLLQGKNMVKVFAACELAVMATGTLRGQSLEYGIDVTRLARQMRVQPN